MKDIVSSTGGHSAMRPPHIYENPIMALLRMAPDGGTQSRMMRESPSEGRHMRFEERVRSKNCERVDGAGKYNG